MRRHSMKKRHAAAENEDETRVEGQPAGEGAEQTGETPVQPESDADRARAALRKFTESDTEGDKANVTLRSILGGDILAGAWFRKQILFILMLVVFVILYVSNRYASQQELLEIDALQKQRIDEQYRALTRSSELMELTRRSSVENYLRTTNDSTIQTSTTPPYTLEVTEE